MKVIKVYLLLMLFDNCFGGRTTNKFYSLENGGFHHHGGFLGGYFDFYRGNINNSQDSFSRKYKKHDGERHYDGEHYIYKTRKPTFEKIDSRLLIPIPPNMNETTFYLEKLFNKQESFQEQ